MLDNRPKIYVEGEWKFICTECFDNIQANKFCAVLGYEEGTVLTDASNITYTEQAEYHQPCNPNEPWSYSGCSKILCYIGFIAVGYSSVHCVVVFGKIFGHQDLVGRSCMHLFIPQS